MAGSPLTYKSEHFLDFTEKYLVVIASCLPKKVDPAKEPTLANTIDRYAEVNVYQNGKKKVPGQIEVVGGYGKDNQKIVVVYGQFYHGKNTYPNDNKQKRIAWFVQALDEIAELSGLEQGVAFPTEICRDGGGNWSEYYQSIRDFAQTLQLKMPNLKVCIYQHPQPSTENPTTQSQISLLNCDNLIDDVALENIWTTQLDQVAIQPAKPTLEMTAADRRKIRWGGLKLKEDTATDEVAHGEAAEAVAEQTLIKEALAPGETFYPQTSKNPDWQDSLVEAFKTQAHPSWQPIFDNPTVQKLLRKVDQELKPELAKHGNQVRFLPSYENIFNAFRRCPFDQLKVVILGQDPYFSNLNEAHGLSFSVPKGVTPPPSLKNIFKELENCIGGYSSPDHGDLTWWAEQGVLLLNTSLTVLHKQKEAHMKIWREFTDHIIEMIGEMKTTPVIFMLWGNHAKQKDKLINAKKHLILRAVHPSPLGASRGGWFDTRHFSLANQKLQNVGLDIIDWQT